MKVQSKTLMLDKHKCSLRCILFPRICLQHICLVVCIYLINKKILLKGFNNFTHNGLGTEVIWNNIFLLLH